MEELIYQILQVPFEHFKNFNQITTKNFEVIFKKCEREHETVFDPLNHNPLIEHISFLRLLLDDSSLKNEGVQMDDATKHKKSSENQNGATKSQLSSLVEELLHEHKDLISEVKKKL